MADFGRGIKAGVAAATVYLIISVIIAAIGRTFWYPSGFIFAAGLGIHLELMHPLGVIFSILSRIVQGIIFGVVFAALYNFLPSVSSIVKGMVLSLFLCIVALIETIYMTPGWPTDGMIVGGLYARYGGVLYLSSISRALAGIISVLAFGALVGAIWNKLREKKVTEVRKGIAALLVGFILGGVTWAFLAVLYLTAVVTEGVPAIDPDFWWFELLVTSVVFLGLPGWVLALVAWRKTKRGESGFKWGVAGGVIMALTGVMLLPGVLAIIGGVFSARKPVSESSTAEIEQ